MIAIGLIAIVFAGLGLHHGLGFLSHTVNHLPAGVYNGILGAGIVSLVAGWLCPSKTVKTRRVTWNSEVEVFGEQEKIPELRVHPEGKDTRKEGSGVRPEFLTFLQKRDEGEPPVTKEEALKSCWWSRDDLRDMRRDSDDKDNRRRECSERYGNPVMPGELKYQKKKSKVTAQNEKHQTEAQARAESLSAEVLREASEVVVEVAGGDNE